MTILLKQTDKSYKAVIASGQTSLAVKIPTGVQQVTVMLIPAGGASGKSQFTTSTYADIAAGTATWVDMPKGVVSATSYEGINFPVTAVRGVSVSGNVTLEVVL